LLSGDTQLATFATRFDTARSAEAIQPNESYHLDLVWSLTSGP